MKFQDADIVDITFVYNGIRFVSAWGEKNKEKFAMLHLEGLNMF